MMNIKREDLRVKWAFDMSQNPMKLDGQFNYLDDPKNAKPRLHSTVYVPMSVLLQLRGKERKRSKMIEIAEEQILLDIKEINGEAPFDNQSEPDEGLLKMREALRREKA